MFVNTDLITAAGQTTPAELIAAGEWTWEQRDRQRRRRRRRPARPGLIVRDFDYKVWDNLATDLDRLGRLAVERGRQDLRLRPASRWSTR